MTYLVFPELRRSFFIRVISTDEKTQKQGQKKKGKSRNKSRDIGRGNEGNVAKSRQT